MVSTHHIIASKELHTELVAEKERLSLLAKKKRSKKRITMIQASESIVRKLRRMK